MAGFFQKLFGGGQKKSEPSDDRGAKASAVDRASAARQAPREPDPAAARAAASPPPRAPERSAGLSASPAAAPSTAPMTPTPAPTAPSVSMTAPAPMATPAPTAPTATPPAPMATPPAPAPAAKPAEPSPAGDFAVENAFLLPPNAKLVAEPVPVTNWNKVKVEVKDGVSGFVLVEDAEQAVHGISRVAVGVAPGQTVRLAAVVRPKERPVMTLWIYGDGPATRPQVEAILDLKTGSVVSTRTANDGAALVDAGVQRLSDGWLGVYLAVKLIDPAVKGVTIMLVARRAATGPTAYQGEGSEVAEIYGISATSPA